LILLLAAVDIMLRSLSFSFVALMILAGSLGGLLSGCGMADKPNDPTAGWSAARLYQEAKEELDGRNYAQAIKLYESLEARYPYGRFAQQAQLEVAYAYYKQNEQASAVAAIDRFLKLYPNNDNVEYAMYLKGLVWFNEDRGLLAGLSDQDPSERDSKGARDAFDAFKELLQRFPDGKYTVDATARMKYLVNSLAWNDVHVARYYMKRGAYIAAANRSQSALTTYPGAPALEEALFIMVKAYDALGMNDLRDDADKVMHKNFPNSEYFKRGLNRTAPWWKLWDPNW
jgi:outer membrane protein assembly factor BamD